MDPFSLLMAAQATVAAIRSGCEMLSHGKAEITKTKATIDIFDNLIVLCKVIANGTV